MELLISSMIVLAGYFICAHADVSHILNHKNYETTPEPGPQNPYIFSYQAGRAPGHVDRQHTEVSDGSGVVRGAFSYVDPKNQLRTVQYVADKNGFHPQLSHEQEDTAAVKRAKEKHFSLYNRIAQEHSAGSDHPGHEPWLCLRKKPVEFGHIFAIGERWLPMITEHIHNIPHEDCSLSVILAELEKTTTSTITITNTQ